ncbi:hypothetical protein PR048_018568 [Dryococelus australis]|uniref:Uncharacterized protein n=1 Tax=Dryococelus australis TaxID=614101 RepID=A0ABQ9HCS3_9NEOP|nr:hypothetical protein PR048_018568 [Dryococelus australis]
MMRTNDFTKTTVENTSVDVPSLTVGKLYGRSVATVKRSSAKAPMLCGIGETPVQRGETGCEDDHGDHIYDDYEDSDEEVSDEMDDDTLVVPIHFTNQFPSIGCVKKAEGITNARHSRLYAWGQHQVRSRTSTSNMAGDMDTGQLAWVDRARSLVDLPVFKPLTYIREKVVLVHSGTADEAQQLDGLFADEALADGIHELHSELLGACCCCLFSSFRWCLLRCLLGGLECCVIAAQCLCLHTQASGDTILNNSRSDLCGWAADGLRLNSGELGNLPLDSGSARHSSAHVCRTYPTVLENLEQYGRKLSMVNLLCRFFAKAFRALCSVQRHETTDLQDEIFENEISKICGRNCRVPSDTFNKPTLKTAEDFLCRAEDVIHPAAQAAAAAIYYTLSQTQPNYTTSLLLGRTGLPGRRQAGQQSPSLGRGLCCSPPTRPTTNNLATRARAAMSCWVDRERSGDEVTRESARVTDLDEVVDCVVELDVPHVQGVRRHDQAETAANGHAERALRLRPIHDLRASHHVDHVVAVVREVLQLGAHRLVERLDDGGRRRHVLAPLRLLVPRMIQRSARRRPGGVANSAACKSNPSLGSHSCSFKFCQRRVWHTRVTSIRRSCGYPTYDLLAAAMACAPIHNVCSVVVTPLESRRATSWGYNISPPVRHALYECVQDIYGDSSPFLLQPFHELSNGFGPRLTSPQPAIQFVPKMLYRVEVGALGGPVH